MKKQVYYLFVLFLASTITLSCSKDGTEPSATLNQSEVNLNYDGEFQFVVSKGNESVDFSTLTASSSNEFVGRINNSGMFEANKVGETTIKIMGDGISLEATVTVTPYHELFDEPIIDFTANKTTIRDSENRKFVQEVDEFLIFEGENSRINNVVYLFGANGRLRSAMSLYPTTSSLVENIAVFYLERYDYLGQEDDIFVFRSEDKSILVGLGNIPVFGFGATYFSSTSSQAIASLSKLNDNKLSDQELKMKIRNISK